MIDALVSELFAPLAVAFGSLGLLFPAPVTRRTRLVETRLRSYVRGVSVRDSDGDPSSRRVRLTRLLGGWGVVVGLAGLLAPAVYLWLLAASYAAAFVGALGYAVVRFGAGGTTAVR